MKQLIPCLAVLLCGVSLAHGTSSKALLTVAESSEFAKTSLYDDVMAFVHELQRRSDHIRVETLCKSAEGRDVPLWILGNPVPASVDQLKHDKRLVVYIQANIHAGEVEGKEAVQMLARDMLLGDKQKFLDGLIVLITPIFNPDGNEKLGHNRRDKGPELAGVRHSGLMLDLNRDGVKLESPEVTAMVRTILNQWDPALFVDCHTTNGSYHNEPVTYAWPLNPNGDRDIIRFTEPTRRRSMFSLKARSLSLRLSPWETLRSICWSLSATMDSLPGIFSIDTWSSNGSAVYSQCRCTRSCSRSI